MGKALKSTVELATTGFESENQPPPPFEPRVIEPSIPEPAAEKVAALSKVGIKDADAGRRFLIEKARRDLDKLSTTSPAIHLKIVGDLMAADALRANAVDLIEPSVRAVGEIESRLKIRGDLNL